MRRSLGRAVLVVAIALSALAGLGTPARAAGAAGGGAVALGDATTGTLDASLSMATPPASSSDPVRVHFSLENTDSVPLAVLTWGTPLEGIRSDLFRVTRNGGPVTYTGMVAKRGAPSAGSYRLLQPGETVSTDVDLREAYALTDAGSYAVTLPLVIADVRRGSASTVDGPVDPATMTPVEATLPSLGFSLTGDQAGAATGVPQVAPGYSGCTASDQATITSTYAATKTLVASTLASLDQAAFPATAPRYAHWFGAHTASRYALVRSHFAAEDGLLSSRLVTDVPWSCNDPSCSSGTFAYVYPTDTSHTIYLCGLFFSAPITGADSAPGVLVHEMSHFVDIAGTDDYVYGQTGAAGLAASSPDLATMNADNHEYFAENPTSLTMGDLRPSAQAQSVTVEAGGSKAITLAGTDPDDDPLTYAVVTGPANGTLTGTGNALTYTPTAPGAVADSFTFVVNDGQVDSAPATVAITIDPPDPVLKPGVGSVVEGNSGDVTLNVPIDLLTPSSKTVTVNYQSFDNHAAGVATVGTDYAATSGTLTFLPGETHKVVALTVHGDQMYEPPLVYGEWAFVQFTGAANATLDTSFFGLGIGVIVDDDPVPTIKPGSAGVVEGASGTTTVVQVPVTLTNPSQLPITVHFETYDNHGTGVATPGVDYVATSGTVTFLPGETTKTVAITVDGDDVHEPPLVYGEWILVRFSAATNATLDTSFFGLGIGVIVDDDPAP